MPQISGWLTANGHVGLIVFIAGFVLFAGMGVLPTYAQAALAGFAFGVPMGLAASVLGFTGASLVGYLIVRSVSGDRVEKLIEQNRKAMAVRELLIGAGPSSFSRTLGMVTLLRLPNTPFAWFNLVMASVRVPLVPFMLGTMIGMLPRTALIVTVGHLVQGVLSEAAMESSSSKGLLWAGIKLSILLLLLISEVLARQVDRIFREPPARQADGTSLALNG